MTSILAYWLMEAGLDAKPARATAWAIVVAGAALLAWIVFGG